MGQPYVGEIRMFGGNFAPAGWMTCDGQLIAISENDTLFNLIGTTYGGDGQETFALPSLNGRVPVHMGQGTGQNYTIGELAGASTVTLTTNQIPIHSHYAAASLDNAAANTPNGNVTGHVGAAQIYTAVPPSVNMGGSSLQSSGGSQPHDNMQPYLAYTYIISMFGVYPSPN
jgi:microcystin-dependent protein